MSRVWGAVLIVAMLFAVGSKRASADEVNEAREHYKKGTKAFELGAYDEAVAEYSAAYRLRDDPALLYNLGQAHRLANHPTEALHFYRLRRRARRGRAVPLLLGGAKQFSAPVGIGTAAVGALTVYDGSTFNPANVSTREVVVGEISAANGFGANGLCTGGLVGPTYCMGASSGTMYWGVVNATGIVQTMRLDSAGNVLIPSGSTYGMFSSARFKKDIHFLDQTDLEKALKLLLDTPIATFRNKAATPETKVAYGVIAEKTPRPLLTQENDAFSMSNAVGVLMASVKAQQAHIAELEARLAKLEGRKQRASRGNAAAPAISRTPAE